MLDNFYTIIQTSQTGENTWTVHIRLNPGHPLYKGHFPEQPVVPGVCMMQFIKESVEQILGQRVQYMQVASCKFLLPIDPVQTPELTLELELKELPVQSATSEESGSADKPQAQTANSESTPATNSQAKGKPAHRRIQLQAEGKAGTDCFIKLKAQLAIK